MIGRVGGLAVALGVGAAAFSGSAVAWADNPASDSSSPHASSARSAALSSAGDSNSSATPAAKHGAAKTAGATHPALLHPVSPAAATRPRTPDTGIAQAPISDLVSGGAPAVDTTVFAAPVSDLAVPAPAVVKIPAPATAISAVPAGVAVQDSSTGGTPLAPAESPLDLALLAYSRRGLAGTARTALPAAATTSLQTAAVLPAAAQTTALIMGPSGVPIPSQTYIDNVNTLYIQPSYPGAVTQVVFTPEGLYPITGAKSLPLDVSVGQGLQILDQTAAPLLSLGTPVTVFGYSQSAIISSLWQSAEAALLPPPQNLSFVLIGNEMNPDGGFLSRFPGLTLPSLGLDFYGATPENLFPTTNYTLEYDGFADFPQYPLNFLADLNAGLGIIFVHTKYADLSPQDVTPVAQGGNAIPLLTTDPSQKYYVIATQNLPLLEPLRLIPLIGNPLADLSQPALKVLVNLGYGDPKYGWSNDGYANVETPFAFLPNVNIGEVVQLLVQGVAQGVSDFVSDFAPGGSFWQELGSIKLPSFVPPSLPTSPGGIIAAIQDVTTGVAAAISNAAASLYAALLPTADVVNAIVTMLPAYNVTLFLDGIQQAIHGDPIAGLINAIGRPLAADVGLVTTASLIEVLVLLQAVQGVFGKQTEV